MIIGEVSGESSLLDPPSPFYFGTLEPVISILGKGTGELTSFYLRAFFWSLKLFLALSEFIM
jgi:hypothetical protein